VIADDEFGWEFLSEQRNPKAASFLGGVKRERADSHACCHEPEIIEVKRSGVDRVVHKIWTRWEHGFVSTDPIAAFDNGFRAESRLLP